jgi:hypothetical protein
MLPVMGRRLLIVQRWIEISCGYKKENGCESHKKVKITIKSWYHVNTIIVSEKTGAVIGHTVRNGLEDSYTELYLFLLAKTVKLV